MAKFQRMGSDEGDVWINIEKIARMRNQQGGQVRITFDNGTDLIIKGDADKLAEFANRMS